MLNNQGDNIQPCHTFERVTGRKARGLKNEGNRLQVSDIFFYLFLKQQEETNYGCQFFFPLLYTKLKGGFY